MFSLTSEGANHDEGPERPADWYGLSRKAFKKTGEWLKNFGNNRQKAPVKSQTHRSQMI